jgi:hypothetical protein
VKSDETVPLRYAAIVGTLLLYRLFLGFRGRIHPSRMPGSVVRVSQSVR